MNTFVPTDRQSIYDNNLAALGKRYPDLFERLSARKSDTVPNLIKLRPDDIFPNSILEEKSRKILYYDAADPMGSCKKFLESLDLHYAPVLIFLGLGLGYQVTSALQHFSRQLNIQYIIIVEKDLELLRAALMTLDLSEVINHPKIELFVGKKPHDLFKLFSGYFQHFPEISHFLKNLKFVIMPSVHLVHSEYYRKVVSSLIHSIMDLLHDLGNDPYDSVLGLKHILANIFPMIQDPGIVSFQNSFKGKPAILIGAGPSLNKNMHLLKEASHKALLVCVDAAFRPLLNSGIQPHLVANIERTKGQDAFFSNLNDLEETFFVFCPVVHPSTYDAYHGPKIIAQRYKEPMKWLGLNTGVLTGGPLIGNFAFDIAQYLGCDPIIMVGQDLSFQPTGPTHVEGMVFGDQENVKKNMIAVEGNFGETLMADVFFDQSRRSLEIQIEQFNGLCINATEGGAKINGTVLMDLKNAMNKHCLKPFDFSGRLKRIWTEEKAKKKDTKVEIGRIRSILEETASDLQNAIEGCKKGLEIVKNTRNKYQLLVNQKPNHVALKNILLADNQLYKIREKIISLPSFQSLTQIFNGYHVDFAMKRNLIFDQFYHREFATLKAFLIEKEWFSIMGQLFLSTLYVIKKSKSRLNKER